MKKTIVIAGPTASGKTGAAIKLAKVLDGEIISADSMQIYKYMDIGTAKPDATEMDGIRHHLMSELYPDEDYSIVMFQQRAKRYISDIQLRGKTPIVAGGTGFYINSLVFSNEFDNIDNDKEYREYLYSLAAREGNSAVHTILKEIDAESYSVIQENNLKRVVRAIEYHKLTGKKISEHNAGEKSRGLSDGFIVFRLDMDRKKLYERIDKRVDMMMSSGLLAEVENIRRLGYSKELVSMKAIGYKEMLDYFNGALSLPEAIDEIKKNTRRYAKRQVTWFKNQLPGAYVIQVDDFGRHIEEMLGIIRNTGALL